MLLISITQENTLSCSRLELDTQVNSRVYTPIIHDISLNRKAPCFFSKWLDVYSLHYCRWKIANQKKNTNRTQTRHIQPCNIPLDSLGFLQWKHSWFHSYRLCLYIHYSPILWIIKENLEQVIQLRPMSMLTSIQSPNKCLQVELDNKNILTQTS